MTSTWDDVLDDFEDMVDECHEALDGGRLPETSSELPDVPPMALTPVQSARLADLQNAAAEAAQRLVDAMADNAKERSRGRDRVSAHREYSSPGRTRR